MRQEVVVKALRELGLTEYEARSYLALVSLGPSTAGEVSSAAGVPYSRVYDILLKLERRGWVEAQPGRPARYRAKPPGEAIERSRLDHQRRFKEISELVLKELGPVYERRAEVKKPDIWVIRGRENLLAKINEMLSRARVEALVTIPARVELPDLKPLVAMFSVKNLPLRVLTAQRLKLESTPPVEVRYREPLFGGGVIIDGREVLLLLTSGREMLGIWSDEVGLTKFAKEYFEYLWKDSKPKCRKKG